MKVSDEDLVRKYEETGSVWKTGDALGLCGQSVHERLSKLGACKHINVFTEEDSAFLLEHYEHYKSMGRLQDLADQMGRTKQFICRKAKDLGLTDRASKKDYFAVWKHKSDEELLSILKEFASSDKDLSGFCKEKGLGEVNFWIHMSEKFPAEYEAIMELKKSNSPMYRRGRDFEYATKRDLEKNGFVVMRSPASKSPADLIAVKRGKATFIQCKLNGAFPVKEWNEFVDYCEKAGAIPVMANRKKSCRGIEYHLITGKKDGSKRRQPMVDYNIEEEA